MRYMYNAITNIHHLLRAMFVQNARKCMMNYIDQQ